ncbi:prenyltransferase/squalene oxidase repeat-containing protein [Nocardioides litoris]|uniref:prenyltransferase/squalene oxidase repeat-containing protein n=1 Tax=Nocardioides litoris TaxID=1926648 RepID=UPI00111CBB5D|nr:prenyltransferase/squalene oxidase repeat-containing protein [Nocardioides litoris]
MSSTLLRRAVALAASAAVASGLALTAAPAQAAPAPAQRSAGWLAGQLDDGLVRNKQFGFDDYGLTADVALALDAVGGRAADQRAIRRALARNLDSWTTGRDFGSSDVYAGSVAKAVVAAQALDRNPRDFGGVNLVSRLGGLVVKTGPSAGRIADRTTGDDFANTIGQAFAVQGLAQARSGKADAALRFLLKQQCSEGFFRLSFAADQAKRKQGCDAGTAEQSAPDTDVTALAVLSLSTLRTTPRTKAAIADATRWLRKTQARNGAFGGGPATGARNSNSTGLAAWALGETGSCRAAAKAARWVSKVRLGNGAIAYDKAAFAAGADGIDTTERDQWRRATAQAAPGLRYLSVRACQG